MVEVEKDFASKGVAGAGLGLGIAGTALGLLGNNVLPGLFNGGVAGNCGRSGSGSSRSTCCLNSTYKSLFGSYKLEVLE